MAKMRKSKTPLELAEKTLATINDYKNVFSSAQGKRVLLDLMKEFHMLGTTHVKNDEYESKLNEGERNAVLFILAKMKTRTTELEQYIAEATRED